MRVIIDQSFDDYVASGNETTDALLGANDDYLQAIRRCHDFFPKVLWAEEQEVRAVAALLSMNAFMLYLAGCRIALTGHVAAVFPLFRTALESACYSYLITQNPALEQVWLDRNKNEAAEKAVRRAFQSAVKDTAKMLEGSGGEELIASAYEASIDFGAHPNQRSVMLHLQDRDAETHVELSLVGLYSADSFEVLRSLVAALDYGLAIAIVVTHCLPAPSEEIVAELQAINDLKNQLAEPLTG